MSNQMPRIEIQFPKSAAESRIFYNRLVGLLVDVPEGAMVDDDIAFASHTMLGALPQITMCESSVPFPQIVFPLPTPLAIALDHFAIRTSELVVKQLAGEQPHAATEIPVTPRMTLEAFGDKLHIHLVRLDHLGINLPASQVDQASWQQLITMLADVTTLYRVPGAMEEYFILPMTPAEFAGKSPSFTLSREPKFAVGYDTQHQAPTLRIDLATNLTQPELAAILPEPFGFSQEAHGETFRSTLIVSPWPGLQVQFDCHARSMQPSAWDIGEWLVSAGERTTGTS